MDIYFLSNSRYFSTLWSVGFSDFTNMSYYFKKREQELITEFGLSEGMSSHDIFSNVFRIINVEKFLTLFVDWTKSLAIAKTEKQIAIDGKAAATKEAEKGNILYIFSAFLCGCGISIGKKEAGEKTNKIPKLLDLINITDCMITIDAIRTQTKIMNKIIEKRDIFVYN